MNIKEKSETLAPSNSYTMEKEISAKKELAQQLEGAILEVLGKYDPELGKKLKKEAKTTGKSLSKKLAEIRKDLEKKAFKKAKSKEKSKGKKKKKSDSTEE